MKKFLCAAALTMFAVSAAPVHAEYISYRSHDAGVESAQLRLKQMGYYRGKLDGVNGPRTSTALAMFQRDNGLMATGSYDYYTQAALFPSNYAPSYLTYAASQPHAYSIGYAVPLKAYTNGVMVQTQYVQPQMIQAQPIQAQPIAYAAQLPVARPIAYTYGISEAVRYGNYYTPAGSQITTVVPQPW
jgi:peptidoglycan hydrolase-like protein with peptidoglycan-binding domain